ncbi:MAG: thioredoxin family protein [Oscillospiraceae bacterium]|nr:thioredoxin family protein [Oscillospiraceae bacterium]
MSATVITRKNFKKEVKRCKTPVLLSFGNNCGVSSLLLKEAADNLNAELQGKIKIGVIECNPANSELAKEYNIRFLPSSILIRNGTVTDRIIGNMRKDDFLKILKTF